MRLADYVDILEKRVKKESNTSSHTSYLKKEISLAAKTHSNLTYPWRELDKDNQTISITSGTSEYTLPNDFDVLRNIHHREFDQYTPIKIISSTDYYQSSLSTTNTGKPEICLLRKNKGIVTQPSAATTVGIQSSDSDDTSIDIRVYGYVGGFIDHETITTNSSNGTTLSTGSKSFTTIIGIVKSAETDGRLTLTADGTTIAVIPAGKATMESNYSSILFHPIPDSSVTAYYSYKRKQMSMNNDNDFCILNDDHDNAILLLAQYFVYGEQNVFQSYVREVKKLVAKEPAVSSDEQYLESRLYPRLQSLFLRMGDNYAYPIY